MSGVFISYRREDSSGYAGRLFDILSAHFGSDNTFMDLDTIKGGDNFEDVIEQKIGLCDVLLAVIGERWLTSLGENGSRRLDAAGDFVRLEIAKALQRGVRVIPVLVAGATMPHQDDLPADLRPLSLHQAMDLRDAHFREDADLLIDVLNKTVPVVTQRPRRTKFSLALASALVVAALAGGALLFWQAKSPPRANPDSSARKDVTPANGSVQPVQVGADKSKSLTRGSVAIAGKWKATVKYDWGDSYEETFRFEFFGQELTGTASFLTVDRGIFEGKVDGNRVTFTTKTQSMLDDKTYEDKHYYKGTVDGDTIRFSILTDSGSESHVPVYFTATRVPAK